VNILDKILAVKRDEIAAAKARNPDPAATAREASASAAAGATRSLTEALRRPTGAPVRVLAEIKRASPSAGSIRPGADTEEIAAEYRAGGAAAISVLTDEQFFDGRLEFLQRVRDRVPLPLLRKDFIIDPYQVVEARAAGADAILLIVAALAPAQLADLFEAAVLQHLDVLVEVHDLREAEVALAAGASLLGVNHRDLRTFTIDMSLTEQIARRVPPSVVLVGESGIKTRADVRRLGDAGAHAVLVGETLMRAPSPGAALKELLS
jgi:indole-3-glycerol phosphate synthase